MSDLSVYQIISNVRSLPLLLVLAEDEPEARVIVTSSLNSRCAASRLDQPRMGGVNTLDQYYLDHQNAVCQKLENGKDYDSLLIINDRQVSICISDKMYIVSKDTATPITEYHEKIC